MFCEFLSPLPLTLSRRLYPWIFPLHNRFLPTGIIHLLIPPKCPHNPSGAISASYFLSYISDESFYETYICRNLTKISVPVPTSIRLSNKGYILVLKWPKVTSNQILHRSRLRLQAHISYLLSHFCKKGAYVGHSMCRN